MASKNSKVSAPETSKKGAKAPWDGHVGTHSDMVVADQFKLIRKDGVEVDSITLKTSDINEYILESTAKVIVAKDDKGFYLTLNTMVDSGLADILRYGARITVQPTDTEGVYQEVK